MTGPAPRELAQHRLLALGVAPIVILSIIPARAALAGEPVAGPAAGSVFARMGPGLSYVLPLFVAAAFLGVRAAFRRSAGYAFAAMLVPDLAANVDTERST